MNTTDSSVPTCRSILYRPSEFTKAGPPRKTNQHPTTCCSCGDRLGPGEAMVGGMDGNAIRWSCGPKRWDRG